MEMTNNDYVLKIPDMTFFQGDTIVIPFEFYDGQGQPIDLTTVSVYWYLCPYGKPKSPTLVLDSRTQDEKGETKIVINEGEKNVCYVNLSVEDTKNMTYVKYTQQPVIVLTYSRGTRRYIRAEGNIIFKPMIKDKKLNSDMDLFRFFK